ITFEEDTFVISELRQGKEIPSDLLLCVEEDANGNLWFGTYGEGAFHINLGAHEDSLTITKFGIQDGLPDLTIWDIYSDKNGDLWFGTGEAGVAKYNGSQFLNYSQKHGLPNNQVFGIMEDSEENLWFGTGGSGLCKFRGTYFSHFSEEDGLAGDNTFAITQDDFGNYWVGSKAKGLTHMIIYNNNIYTKIYTTEDGLSSNLIRGITKDKDGNLWVATLNGLNRIVLTPPSVEELAIPQPPQMDDWKLEITSIFSEDGLVDNSIKAVIVDVRGTVWSAGSYGISGLDSTGFMHITEEKGIANNDVQSILEDKEGNIWFGTLGGLAKYDYSLLHNYDEVEGLLDLRVNTLALGPEGNIWIGTNGGGIYMYDVFTEDTVPIRFITDDHLLSSSIIYSISFFQHIQGFSLLVGTDKGFDKLRFDADYGIQSIRNYTASDGFIGIENNQNAIYMDLDKNIWFGTVKGITCFKPRDEIANLKAPITHITSLKIHFKDISWDGLAENVQPWFMIPTSPLLPFKNNHVTFHFAGLSMYNPQKIKYKYMLEGLDTEWSPETKVNNITFPGLQEGSYTFLVKAVNAEGTWNEEPTQFAFVVDPPWYRTKTFYISVILLLAIFIYTFIKWRERKLIEEKRILEEKVEERTREVIKQKEEIEEKNTEIMDSINYAKKIQQAILPLEEERKELLDDSFVLFKPKDVVSGDFYWMAEKNGDVLITAADCTGHGVPGAFMSMINSALLNEAVNDHNITHPNEVLYDVRKGIVTSLKQTGEAGESKDGMDAALIKVDKKNNKLSFAGAHNPLWLIRTTSDPVIDLDGTQYEPILEVDKYKLYEIKADKQPVGFYTAEMTPFTHHEIDIKPNDMIYLFTDGYADQFGGPKGKKFMSKRFKELLMEIQDKSLEEQHDILDEKIEEWKAFPNPFEDEGDTFEQIDDILVIGVRFQ
ncbi:MAG: SpoIIE family protein phosphatase, partial [Bacteroidetes bacterium]|nr:SpoIIE family protein phosphatase [Bacteroidota bacterium]